MFNGVDDAAMTRASGGAITRRHGDAAWGSRRVSPLHLQVSFLLSADYVPHFAELRSTRLRHEDSNAARPGGCATDGPSPRRQSPVRVAFV